jgi:serine protease Do
MTDIADPLTLFFDRIAALVDGAAPSIVAVHAGRRWPISGIHWRPGIIVTAEEALERDDDLAVSLPDGRRIAATLAGRDPSTDVAVLRFQPDGVGVAETGDAAKLRPGHLALVVGRH